jgi:hypothetical protein
MRAVKRGSNTGFHCNCYSTLGSGLDGVASVNLLLCACGCEPQDDSWLPAILEAQFSTMRGRPPESVSQRTKAGSRREVVYRNLKVSDALLRILMLSICRRRNGRGHGRDSNPRSEIGDFDIFARLSDTLDHLNMWVGSTDAAPGPASRGPTDIRRCHSYEPT